MEKQVKQYTDMSNQEKAQAIYNKLLKDNPEELGNLLFSLSAEYSAEYSDDEILYLTDWVESYREAGNIFDLIQTAQESKELDINDDYIRTSVYYNGYATSDSVIDLVDEYEAVEWIEDALDDRSDLIKDIDKIMQIKFN